MELSERKKRILKLVVEDYIRTAEPVGSKAISAEMEERISSATIRNELADLVELGYLEQPHTSAGRVPSARGYRLYVNELMERQRLSAEESERINHALQIKIEELERMISQTSQVLSAFMNYPAYAAAAGRGDLTVQRFDLLPVDDRGCIVVLMISGDRVRSQLLRLQLKVSLEQIITLTSLLNGHFTEILSAEMNRRLMNLADQLPPEVFLLLSQTIAFATDALEEAGQRAVITAGASALLKLPEFRDVDKAHELMNFLSDGKENLPMPEPEDESPMKILIGPENVNEALKNTSVVVASYKIGGDMRGLIGVVGPTRMDYAAVAARLSGFADGLARLFGKQELPPKEDAEE